MHFFWSLLKTECYYQKTGVLKETNYTSVIVTFVTKQKEECIKDGQSI